MKKDYKKILKDIYLTKAYKPVVVKVPKMKYEWKKNEKEIYLPKNKPVVIDVPAFKYFAIKGAEDCLKNHLQYICSTCGRIICIGPKGAKKGKVF